MEKSSMAEHWGALCGLVLASLQQQKQQKQQQARRQSSWVESAASGSSRWSALSAVLLHQHKRGARPLGQYLAARKIRGPVSMTVGRGAEKSGMKTFWKKFLPQKTDSHFSGSVHNNLSDHSFPPLSSSCPHPPPRLPPKHDWNRRADSRAGWLFWRFSLFLCERCTFAAFSPCSRGCDAY